MKKTNCAKKCTGAVQMFKFKCLMFIIQILHVQAYIKFTRLAYIMTRLAIVRILNGLDLSKTEHKMADHSKSEQHSKSECH